MLCPKKLAENWNTYKDNYVNNPIAADRLNYDVLFHTDLSRDGGYSNELDLNVLRQMDKQLHYHLIFILEYQGQYQLWTGYKEESTNAAFKVGNYYHTDWVTEDRFSLRIDGLNMDTIYENLVRQIAGNALVKESD